VLLKKLRELGVKIYLDDFGTGHSSLSHLHQLPVDALKIDRSFVESLLLPERPAIVESILALAYTLETGVVAEGVEDEVQALALERLGCRYAQGYLFSPAIPPAKIEALLESGEALVSARRLMVDRSPTSQLTWNARAEVPAELESELIIARI
jgi:sensor c-di-GMP phosphodiesterase-like protein